jgi:phosphoribosyl 1,2-cyclic phosphodiesterase
VAEMVGATLNRDRISSRRRWIIALIIFSLIAITLTATSRYHTGRARELAFPVPHSDIGHSKIIEVKEFVKPKDVTIIGLVFFGRRNRVEMLRCYLEVSAQLAYLKPAFPLTQT